MTGPSGAVSTSCSSFPSLSRCPLRALSFKFCAILSTVTMARPPNSLSMTTTSGRSSAIAALHNLDAGEKGIRNDPRHDLGAAHVFPVERSCDLLCRIDGGGAEGLETGQQNAAHGMAPCRLPALLPTTIGRALTAHNRPLSWPGQ